MSLLGNQKKIDANDDGDITAEDFAILRDRKQEGGLSNKDMKNVFSARASEIFKDAGEELNFPSANPTVRSYLRGVDEGRYDTPERFQRGLKYFEEDLLEENFPEKFAEMEKAEIKASAKRYKTKRGDDRTNKAEGSMLMPVDTYPNIPPDEMAEAEASQLPDDEMEEDYIKFVMDESLNDEEQDYLAEALTKDDRLSDILDKVIVTAGEFSGAGEVDGPGTGVSDSIPARLSDGEFVFTKKATDQLGADTLQRMMDDAERAYDGGLQRMNLGGMAASDDEEELEGSKYDLSKTDEEIRKLMIGANKMPSVQ